MRVSLIIPPTELARSYGALEKFSNPTPSLGTAYLAALARDQGHEVQVIDAYSFELDRETILERIRHHAPDVVGFSVLSTCFSAVTELAGDLKRIMPGVKIVMGNIHAGLFAGEILQEGLAEVVVHSEGEYTLSELLKTWENNKSPEEVQGVSWRKKDGTVVHNPSREKIKDLDRLPFPAWDMYDLSLYRSDPRTLLKGFPDLHETQILATRGCPNECTFCSSSNSRSQGRAYRMRSPGNIVDEIEFDLKTYGSHVFSFMDLAFPLVKKHALALCDEIRERGLHKEIGWFSECRVKPLDAETLSAMRNSGCKRICLGIESGNQVTLDKLKKRFRLDDVRLAVKMAKKERIDVDGMFMLGLPGETIEMGKKTVEFAIKLGVRFAIFNIFVPYPGCQLYDELGSEGKIHFSDWSDFISYPAYAGRRPVYVPDGVTREELLDLQRWAMTKFYIRPRFIWNQVMNFNPKMLGHYVHGLKGVLFH